MDFTVVPHQILARVQEWILRGRPTQNGVDWPLDSWIKKFPEYHNFLTSLKFRGAGMINRELTRHEVQNNLKENPLLAYLVAMVWGYADNRLGPSRIRNVFDQPDLQKAIERSVVFLESGDLKSAYRALVVDGPKGVGCSFATKFLYFASPYDIDVKPLILDRIMADALNNWADQKLNSGTTDEEEYFEYCSLIDSWGKELDLNPGDIEEIIFCEKAREDGNQSWANSQGQSELTEHSKLIWALFLASEIMLRNSDYMVFRTHPGGGQYDCIAMNRIDWKNSILFDFNVRGSLHVQVKENLSATWEQVVAKGIQGVVDLWAKPLELKSSQIVTATTIAGATLRKLVQDLISKIELNDFENWTATPINEDGQVREDLLKYFPGISEKVLEYPPIGPWSPTVWLWVLTERDKPVKLFDLLKGATTEAIKVSHVEIQPSRP